MGKGRISHEFLSTDLTMLKTLWNVCRTAWRFSVSSKMDIHVQAAKGNVANINSLLEAEPGLVNLVERMDYGTPLHWASVYGQVESCKELIEHGADIDSMDDCGWTPLCWAIQGKETEVVKLLLSPGAGPNVKDKNGESPLGLAVENQQPEIVALLQKYGAKEHSFD
jgi:ankyrin repeat protein